MRFLIAFIGVAGVLAVVGCGNGKKGEDVDPKTGLTAEQYQLLQSINSSFRDLDLALDLGTSDKENAPNEKVSALAKIIKDSGCERGPNSRGSGPPETYDKEWVHNFSVGGAGCSLAVARNWKYVMRSTTRIWTTDQQYQAKSKELGEKSPIRSLSIQSGDLSVENINGGTQRVKGDYTFSNFMVQDVGLITAALSTNQSYNAFRVGGGNVTFSMNAPKVFRVKVTITWRAKGETKYNVNGHNVDRAVVEDLFSSYGLLEIEARSKKMLY